jgi:hypothetical protein
MEASTQNAITRIGSAVQGALVVLKEVLNSPVALA